MSTSPPPPTAEAAQSLDETPPKHHSYRWRLHRGGIVNVWFYFDSEFTFSGGRCIWRGTNGAGKSRALEMLLPFLLDADRRKIDATGAGKVRLEDLMKAGSGDQSVRLGYLWLELVGVDDNGDPEHLTIGALLRFSKSTAEAKAWYFTTPLRIGFDIELLDDHRIPLSRDRLVEYIGSDRVTDSPETHRGRVRSLVFALTGESGRERYSGLLQLMHTLRSPDVGNRIEEGKLPHILSESLPPLAEAALASAGEQLDALSETRAAQQRLDAARGQVVGFLDVYRRYTAGVLINKSGSARAAAAADRAAEADAHAKSERHGELCVELTATQERRAALDESEDELRAAISGIKESKEYADARELDQRGQQVQALAQAADRSLQGAEAAREREGAVVDEADDRATEVADAATRAADALRNARELLDAAAVPGALPLDVTAVIDVPSPTIDVARCSRTHDPEPVARPEPKTVALLPTNQAETIGQTQAVRRAAHARAGQAAHRHSVATDVAKQRELVDRAEERADEADTRAESAAEEALESSNRRDDEAITLALEWRRWITDPATITLLGAVDWAGTAISGLLTDSDALTGPGEAAQLDPLDTVPEAAAAPARDTLADQIAAIKVRQKEADRVRAGLVAEQADLRAARDPDPAVAPWHTSAPVDGVPLWRAVDFAANVEPATRAGVESALHAAGLLTATVTEGSLTAGNGQILVAATGPTAEAPLSEVLVPDPAAGLTPTIVTALLDRVSFGDRTHPVWVDTDGSWGNGPLTGRHISSTTRHIGAEARAATRAARLDAIDAELAALDIDDNERRNERRTANEQRVAITEHLRSAPRTTPLARLRDQAAADTHRSDAAATHARTLRATAAGLRTQWSAAHTAHEVACVAIHLPLAADELIAVKHAAHDAERACELLIERLTAITERVQHHTSALNRIREASERRTASEDAADADCRRWQRADAEFTALRANIGHDADRIRTELNAIEARCEETGVALRGARREENDISGRVAAAEQDAKHARQKAQERHDALRAEADELIRVVTLPGVLAAAISGDKPVAVALPTVTAAAVDSAAQSLANAADQRGGVADENTLIRAQQKLEREVSGTFDVLASIAGDVRLIELEDATGRMHLADAAAVLTRRTEEGRSALSDRERDVFTDFVLGGVAEELRGRLRQARHLVDAMNASLATIRTSHGIGVKVRWNLLDEADSSIARIRELVTMAGEVRTVEQTAQLTELIKDRVSIAFEEDPTAGYATHLKTALDYRSWHEIVVLILGPTPGLERKISRRARLSQGETRFVSYVTLFAAVDAYLSSLPDTTRALRLILLDDAFAKVDDRTIGELMGLLVRLDIDFAMTGHALWGCYPQVPAIDVYEVRRGEGTAAVTTHVHWDGRNRHLRAAR